VSVNKKYTAKKATVTIFPGRPIDQLHFHAHFVEELVHPSGIIRQPLEKIGDLIPCAARFGLFSCYLCHALAAL